jgi:hypothetical protein
MITCKRWRQASAVTAALVALPLGLASPQVGAVTGYRDGDTGRRHGPPGAVEVLARVKLGTYIEDVTYIATGPHAHHLALLDGYAVRAMPARARSDRATKELFDVRDLGFAIVPRGIAWVDSDGAFAFVDILRTDILFRSDARGRPLPPLPLRYPVGFVPEWLDGLEYIPPGAPRYGDHLVAAATVWDEDFGYYRPRYVVFDREGGTTAIITPSAEVEGYFGYGVAYQQSGTLVVSIEESLCVIDLEGEPVGAVATLPYYADGLATLADGSIIASLGAALRFFDPALSAQPQHDRNAGTGAGLVFPIGLDWDRMLGRFVLAAYPEDSGGAVAQELHVYGLAPPFRTATQLVDLGTDLLHARIRGSALVEDEGRYAVLLRRRGAAFPDTEIAFYDLGGSLAERLPVAPLHRASSPWPLGLTYLPDVRHFAITSGGMPTTLRIVDRAGALVRDVDFSATGLVSTFSRTYLPATGDRGARFVFSDLSGTDIVTTDVDANVVGRFDYRSELRVNEPPVIAAITSGPMAGAMAVVEQGTHDLVVFRIR